VFTPCAVVRHIWLTWIEVLVFKESEELRPSRARQPVAMEPMVQMVPRVRWWYKGSVGGGGGTKPTMVRRWRKHIRATSAL